MLHLVREVPLINETVLFISISPPSNINETDLWYYEIREVSSNVTLKLTNETTWFLFVLPQIAGSTEIRAVAVDRCHQRSIARALTGKSNCCHTSSIMLSHSCTHIIPHNVRFLILSCMHCSKPACMM